MERSFDSRGARLEGFRWLLFVVSAAAMMASCGQPFRVRNEVRPTITAHTGQTSIDGLTVDVRVITDEDELMDRFSANLTLARVMVISLTVRNHGDQPVDFNRVTFDLRDARASTYKHLKPRKTVEQLYKYYEITSYRIAARQEVEADFERNALDGIGEIDPGEQRHGFAFFEMPRTLDRFSPIGELVLCLKRVQWLRSKQKMDVEISLTP